MPSYNFVCYWEDKMRYFWLPVIFLSMMLFGCGAVQNSDSAGAESAVSGARANAFNPWLNEKLPNLRPLSDDGAKMLGSLGARAQTIEGEAKHRKNWRDEIYPVVFGDRKAPGELIVLLNFSSPESEKVWRAVVESSKSLQPSQCKIVVYGRSQENYGTDLMGLAIWLSHSRPGQAMSWLTYALSRWNEVKAAQKAAGKLKQFTNEYDATATAQDFPIHYGYLSHIQPPVPASQELAVAKYCYNAGNVNMYQATQVCQYYGVSSLPAVIADGKVLGKISAASILSALSGR